eukprot:GHVO01066562.1.p1 GENE.GHVO01066562.1~~GHVO01066562.1.p1  ORF type:complete len:123 (+),score=3.61 GHVO01066562.1:98-466(+)
MMKVLGLLIVFVTGCFADCSGFSGSCVERGYPAERHFTGVRSCGNRDRIIDEGRTACGNTAPPDMGSNIAIHKLGGDPEIVDSDANQSRVCVRKILNTCVDFSTACDGWVKASCPACMCFVG